MYRLIPFNPVKYYFPVILPEPVIFVSFVLGFPL